MVDSDAKNLSETSSAKSGATSLSTAGCVLVLTTAFLGWMFSGVHMGINALAMRNAADDLLERHFLDHGVSSAAVQSTIVDASIRDRYDANQDGSLDQRELAKAREGMIGQWFGWLIAAFLFGAAAGGYLFGWVGDRFGRAKAMAFSILCYSLFSAATVWVQEPWQLWLLRFLTCLGIGGMWPNGIALVSEAWPNISRPMLAGAIGTAANVGIMIFALITVFAFVTTENWRWVMWFGATPVVLGFLVLLIVPESPRWLELKLTGPDTAKPPARISDVFRPPILKTTLIGISLGTVPLFGGWGSANWANAWAGQVGDKPGASGVQTPASPDSEEPSENTPSKPPQNQKSNPTLKSWVVLSRAAPGSVTSLLGGALAMWLGRRRCYFLLSLGALCSAQFLFWFNEPGNFWFYFWNACLGIFNGFFFGWLPFCLPEMFPTRVRSAGAGVSFNWGRILTAFGVLIAAGLLKTAFDGDYGLIGRVTSLVYALGLVVVFFMPDTSQTTMDD